MSALRDHYLASMAIVSVFRSQKEQEIGRRVKNPVHPLVIITAGFCNKIGQYLPLRSAMTMVVNRFGSSTNDAGN
jgi:hypothetical protein